MDNVLADTILFRRGKYQSFGPKKEKLRIKCPEKIHPRKIVIHIFVRNVRCTFDLPMAISNVSNEKHKRRMKFDLTKLSLEFLDKCFESLDIKS